MIKIVHILTDTNIGGAGIWLINMLSNISDDFDITVILPRNSLLKKRIEILKDIKIVEVDNIEDTSFSIKGTVSLYKELKELKPDIVHTHASLSGRISGKLNKAYVINSRHCVEISSKNPIIFQLKKILNDFFSNKIIAVSEGVYDNIIDSGVKKEKALLINNGVKIFESYTEDKKYKIREKYNVKENQVHIGFVGRLEFIKGPMFVIDIIENIIKKDFKDFKVTIAGEGTLRKALEEDIKNRRLEKYIQCVGFVDNVEELYNSMDICINTSRSEAISLSLIEAMSLKLPVLAFDVDGLDKVVDNNKNGFLIEAFNTEKYAGKLLELINDQNLCSEFGKESYKIMNEKYHIDQMIKVLENLYKERR